MKHKSVAAEGDKKEVLRFIFQRKFPSVTVNDVTIPDGKKEDEIWWTFEIVYEKIK